MFGDNSMAEGFRNDPYAQTIDQLEPNSRIAYLKKVYAWTFFGLFVAAITGVASIFAILTVPILQNHIVALIVIFGGMFITQGLCVGMVRNPATAVMGFILGNAVEGFTLGYILLAALLQAAAMTEGSNPYFIIGQALGLTLLVTLSIAAYVWTNPSEFRWASAILSAMFLPMLVCMGLFVFAPGLTAGPIGLVISIVFVAISCIGLLKSTSDVMHHLDEDQVIPGAYLISIGILILFWNLLQLLMRLQRD